MKPRQLILGGLLAAVLVASFWPHGDDTTGVVEPVRKSARAHQPAAQPAQTTARAQSPSRTGRHSFASLAEANLFPAQSFRPPPPPPPPPAPPPPPMAPPVPFSFVGIWTEAGKESVFLGQGERTLRAQKGDELAGGWRLDQLSPDALVFTYLPLNQQRTLRIAP